MAEIKKTLGSVLYPRGTYSADATYYKNNVVQYNNASYYLKVANAKGVTPGSDATKWGMMASGTEITHELGSSKTKVVSQEALFAALKREGVWHPVTAGEQSYSIEGKTFTWHNNGGIAFLSSSSKQELVKNAEKYRGDYSITDTGYIIYRPSEDAFLSVVSADLLAEDYIVFVWNNLLGTFGGPGVNLFMLKPQSLDYDYDIYFTSASQPTFKFDGATLTLTLPKSTIKFIARGSGALLKSFALAENATYTVNNAQKIVVDKDTNEISVIDFDAKASTIATLKYYDIASNMGGHVAGPIAAYLSTSSGGSGSSSSTTTAMNTADIDVYFASSHQPTFVVTTASNGTITAATIKISAVNMRLYNCGKTVLSIVPTAQDFELSLLKGLYVNASTKSLFTDDYPKTNLSEDDFLVCALVGGHFVGPLAKYYTKTVKEPSLNNKFAFFANGGRPMFHMLSTGRALLRMPDTALRIMNDGAYEFNSVIDSETYFDLTYDYSSGLLMSKTGALENLSITGASKTKYLLLGTTGTVSCGLIAPYIQERSFLRGQKVSNLVLGSSLVLAHITDVHGNIAVVKDSLAYINTLAKYNAKIPMLHLNTGDTVSTLSDEGYDSYDSAISDATAKYTTSTFTAVPSLHIAGNHDKWTTKTWTNLDRQSVYANIVKKVADNAGIIQPENAEAQGLLYYYYDRGGVRVICIDSTGSTQTSEMDNAELNWFAAALEDARSKGLPVLCASHGPLADQEVVDCDWGCLVYDSYQPNGEFGVSVGAQQAVKDFIDAGGVFIAYIVGHTHTDWITRSKLDPRQLCLVMDTSSGTVPSTTAVKGSHNMDVFNLIGIDTAKTLIKIVRMGDRETVFLNGKDSLVINYKTGKIMIS